MSVTPLFIRQDIVFTPKDVVRNFRDTVDSMCLIKNGNEEAIHFLLQCHPYTSFFIRNLAQEPGTKSFLILTSFSILKFLMSFLI